MTRGSSEAAGADEKLFVEAYERDASKRLPSTHRLAWRPWLVADLDRTPALLCRRRVSRQRFLQRRANDAKERFLQSLRQTYGTEVRGWRRALDTEGNFRVTLPQVQTYCRRMGLPLDVSELWRELDADGAKKIGLEDCSMYTADVLASFRKWARDRFERCTGLWDHLPCAGLLGGALQQQAQAGGWASNKKLMVGAFARALKALGWPGAEDAATRTTLCSNLDLLGCGFIERTDLEWLDDWNPPLFLMASPDPEAWAKIRSAMLDKYKHPLRAWRRLLDLDGSNQVSWREFSDACHQLGVDADVAGAWRHLDEKMTGKIGMREYHPPSADILESFKQWADDNFGSVTLCFQAIDADGGGLLSLSELRRAAKLGYSGEVRLLFDCLDVRGADHDGKRGLTLKDMSFMDSWESAAAPAPALAATDPEATAAVAASRQSRRRRASTGSCSLGAQGRRQQPRRASCGITDAAVGGAHADAPMTFAIDVSSLAAGAKGGLGCDGTSPAALVVHERDLRAAKRTAELEQALLKAPGVTPRALMPKAPTSPVRGRPRTAPGSTLSRGVALSTGALASPLTAVSCSSPVSPQRAASVSALGNRSKATSPSGHPFNGQRQGLRYEKATWSRGR
eukprot:TRINITY_DN14869_c0_g2_i1.p1 TRINITY_DN14869_c0_g2~~TRINITY_DN14869_c0_g2_i1.p1  ORF type:complete len:625 (+),score=117.25 TRINITY_DN14869_c0_g2_i1:126-2000(+)